MNAARWLDPGLHEDADDGAKDRWLWRAGVLQRAAPLWPWNPGLDRSLSQAWSANVPPPHIRQSSGFQLNSPRAVQPRAVGEAIRPC